MIRDLRAQHNAPPSRKLQAFIKAGAPKEAFSFYPADHEGSTAIIRRCDRVMLFGGDSIVWFSAFFTVGVLLFSEIAPKI